MMYDVVKQSLEEFVIANWSDTDVSTIQFDNVPFNTDLFDEYVQFSVRFGESVKRSLPKGCYRQPGMVIFTVKTRPDQGSQRKLELARSAAEMLVNAVISPTLPLVAPRVVMREPSLFDDNSQRDGWVMAQVSCPFYYDLEY
jgi:hypothetical protein